MKRWILFLAALSLLLYLTGCSGQEERNCRFYYLRTAENIRYGQENGLVAPVDREISDQNAELNYLLQLYLEGPVEEGYVSPIPKGTYLLSILWNEDTPVLVLSREFSAANNITLTLCGACLTATCHDVTGAERIEVRSGDDVYHFALSDYTFVDNSNGQ